MQSLAIILRLCLLLLIEFLNEYRYVFQLQTFLSRVSYIISMRLQFVPRSCQRRSCDLCWSNIPNFQAVYGQNLMEWKYLCNVSFFMLFGMLELVSFLIIPHLHRRHRGNIEKVPQNRQISYNLCYSRRLYKIKIFRNLI